MIQRRKLLAFAIFFLSVAAAAILCVLLPESYRSTTLILVEGQKVPENYVQAIVGPSIEERLNSIQQQVLSRTLLTQIIQEFSLYQDEFQKPHGMETVLERLRKDVKITTHPSSTSRATIDAFSISFAHGDPILAMKVTSKLASHFIEENLKVREQLVEGTSEFLEQELKMAQERLESQERAISAFKAKHMGELPGQVQANISALDRLQLQQGSTIEALQKASDRLTMLEKAIKEHRLAGGSVFSMTQGSGAVMMDPHLVRLKELEKQLATLSSEYKDTYPDIIHLKEEIKKIKLQIATKEEEKDDTDKTATQGKEVRSIDVYLRELSRQREEAKLEIASLKDRLLRIKEQAKEYETRVEKAPSREQELMILERDYTNLKENYRSLLDKKLNARLSENLEKRQKGEQFRVIDPANLPSKPEKPDRTKIMLVGLILGCGLGAGSAIALEYLNPVFRRSDDVEGLLHHRVLASIPSFKYQLQAANRLSRTQETTPVRVMIEQRLPEHASDNIESEAERKVANTREGGLSTLEAERQRVGIGQSRDLELIGKWSPWSVVAEQFRVAATRLSLLHSTKGGNVTVITSAVKGEGKSAVAANLAYTLARDLGKLTLLVDADLKCPTAHQFMKIPQSPGLRDVLRRANSVDSCLYQEDDLTLWILPSGLEMHRNVDLSKVHQIAGIISEIKGRYDHVIIDAPPILPLADMHVLAGMANVLALVIRAGITPRTVVESALKQLGETNNVCIILNGLEDSGVPYYMRSAYEYLLQGEKAG
jgi:polysaccharide chain length determinant protein (PEP-CTERM system associated)